MKIENRTTFFIFLFFALINVLDIITALFIAPGEANPLFLIMGNFYVLFILKIAVVWSIGYYVIRNIFPTNFMYYTIIMIMVTGSIVISLGVASNIYGITNPDVLEESSKATPAEKAQAYSLFITVIYIIPVLFNLFTFWLYDRSLKKAKINKEFFKNLKWWKL